MIPHKAVGLPKLLVGYMAPQLLKGQWIVAYIGLEIPSGQEYELPRFDTRIDEQGRYPFLVTLFQLLDCQGGQS